MKSDWIPNSVIGKMHMIVALLEEPKECECECCGNKHMTSGGLFSSLERGEKEKLIEELRSLLNQGPIK